MIETSFSITEQLKQYEGKYFTESKSKAGQWLKYKILTIEDGNVEVEIEVRNDMTNPLGMLHGGMAAMICDEICGLAFYSTNSETVYTTVNLSIDYLYGVAEGEKVIAHGKVVRKGKKVANTTCTIYDKNKNIIVHATSNLLNTDKPVFDLVS